MQEENASASIYGWVKNILKLYDSGRERSAKRIAALLNAKRFGLSGIQKTLNDVPACIQFVRETDEKKLKKTRFRKQVVSIEKTIETKVSIVY